MQPPFLSEHVCRMRSQFKSGLLAGVFMFGFMGAGSSQAVQFISGSGSSSAPPIQIDRSGSSGGFDRPDHSAPLNIRGTERPSFDTPGLPRQSSSSQFEQPSGRAQMPPAPQHPAGGHRSESSAPDREVRVERGGRHQEVIGTQRDGALNILNRGRPGNAADAEARTRREPMTETVSPGWLSSAVEKIAAKAGFGTTVWALDRDGRKDFRIHAPIKLSGEEELEMLYQLVSPYPVRLCLYKADGVAEVIMRNRACNSQSGD